MNLLLGEDQRVTQWVADRVDADFPMAAAIGVVDDNNDLVAGVVYSNFRGCDVEMSCAAETAQWLSRARLRAFFSYPFEQLKCLRVTAIVDKKNKHSRKFIEKMGYKLEGTHPLALDGRTAMSYGMLRKHCKWIDSNG